MKFSKTDQIAGLSAKGSTASSFRIGKQGYFLGAISKILKPYLPFECAILLENFFNSMP
jgi:hypothetical protein